jgi:glycogen(starch) synthase
LRIGFFVLEYPPQLVSGLGTYAEYITREFVELGHDVSVFTLNPGARAYKMEFLKRGSA